MDARGIGRRELLRGFAALSGMALIASRANGSVRCFASPLVAKGAAGRKLVLVQLSGGNDGLSVVVPHGEDAYYRARPTLAFKKSDVLALDDYRGLHKNLPKLRKAYDAGTFAIVEGAGYPNPIRSHFKSMDVWHTADVAGRAAGEGWIGKLCDCAFESDHDPNLVVHVGSSVPYSLYSPTHPAASFINPAAYRWAGAAADTDAYEKAGAPEEREHSKKEPPKKKDGESNLDFLRRVMADGQSSSEKIRRAVARYHTTVAYDDNEPLSAALHDIAALVDSDVGSRVLSVEISGFDTHVDQKNRHDALMRTLDNALAAFVDDLARSEAGKSAVVVVFSEFGRRLHENGARGTDHGVAAPMFLLGHAIRGGLHGKHPSLSTLDDGDLVHTTDFRSVYASVIERCFGLAHDKVLGAKYPLLEVV